MFNSCIFTRKLCLKKLVLYLECILQIDANVAKSDRAKMKRELICSLLAGSGVRNVAASYFLTLPGFDRCPVGFQSPPSCTPSIIITNAGVCKQLDV